MRLPDGLRRMFAPAATGPQKPPQGEYGTETTYGTATWASSFDNTENAPELIGRNRYITYDEMRRSDATCRSLLWMMKLPIRSASWEMEPASEDPVDLLVKDAVSWNLGLGDDEGHLAQSWGVSLDQALLMLAFGAMFEELVWSNPNDGLVPWRDDDGDEHQLLPLERLSPRKPRTIERVEMSGGRVSRVTQWLPGARPIPGEKLAYYVLEPEGGWEGTAVLRAAFGPWLLKKQLMIAAGIGWDRFSAGLPVVRYPINAGQAEKDKAEDIGRSIRLHERGYVVLEGSKPLAENAGQGWDVEILSGAHTLADPTPLLRWYSMQIAEAGLEQFSQLGTSEHGSRAVGEVLANPFYQAVEAIAQELARERTRQVVRRIVDVNFGPQVETPRLTVSKIDVRGLELIANVIERTKTAGFRWDDASVQNAVRDLMRFEHLPDDWVDEQGKVKPGEGEGLPRVPTVVPPVPVPPVPPPG